MKTLNEIQEEVREWAEQFGDNESAYTGQMLFSLPPLLGMMEELGELAAPTCKRHQGRYKQDLTETERQCEYRKDVKDALADLMIFMCDYANREGVDLISTLNAVWETVRNRSQKTWDKDKAGEESYGGEEVVGENARQQEINDSIAQANLEAAQRKTRRVNSRYTPKDSEGYYQNGQGWAEPIEVEPDDFPEMDLASEIPETVQKELDPKQAKESTQTGWETARLIAETYAEGQNREMAMRTIDRYEEMEKEANA